MVEWFLDRLTDYNTESWRVQGHRLVNISLCSRSLDAISIDVLALLPRTRFWVFSRRFILTKTDFTERIITKTVWSRIVECSHKGFSCPNEMAPVL